VNASTATIYRYALDRPMDEQTGEIGGNEPNAPAKWRFCIDVATSWEKTFFDPVTPNTRKIALRSAVVMSPDRGEYSIHCFVWFGLVSEEPQPAVCNLLKSCEVSLSALTPETLLAIGQTSSTARNCCISNPLLLAK
jgi:hypothetical protein